ncbi:MAG TPA: glycosyltransferase, partial [Solirubrobacterales bacterium]|nr:glycosyltransferase [Solirubrobacterales bacterium]
MTEAVFVISPRQNAFFVELAEVICAALGELGIAIRIEPTFDGSVPGRAYLLLPPGEFLEVEGRAAWPDRRTLAQTVFITAEQPGGKHFERNLPLADAAAAWFDLNRLAVREYRRRGFPVEHLQLGYTPLWDRFGTGERDVDVAFLGCATPHRIRAMATWGEPLAGLRSHLVLSDNSRPNPRDSESFVAGDRKLGLMGRTRVLVNAHRGPARYFEWVRVLEAAHCGAAVVSEPSVDHEPMEPGVHLAFAHASDLGRAARDLCDDEPRRQELAASAYQLVRETLSMRHSVERLAESIEVASQRRRSILFPSARWIRAEAIDAIGRNAMRVARSVKPRPDPRGV